MQIILDDRNRYDWHRFAIELKNGAGESISNVFIVNCESLRKFFRYRGLSSHLASLLPP